MITAILGDCLEEMSYIKIHSIDLVLTDTPYNTTKLDWDSIIPLNLHIKTRRKKVFYKEEYLLHLYERGIDYYDAKDDFTLNQKAGMWQRIWGVTKPNAAIVMTAGQPYTTTLIDSNREMFKYCWYWEKERLTNIAQVKKRAGKTIEECAVFYSKQPTYNPIMVKYTGPKRTNKVKDGVMGKLTDSGTKKVHEYEDNGLRYPTQVLKFQRDTLTSNLHPTQKPLKLMEYFIETYTNKGDTVLDFAAGSFTTAIACINLKRKFIGIEIDKDIYKTGIKRIKEHIKKSGRLNIKLRTDKEDSNIFYKWDKGESK